MKHTLFGFSQEKLIEFGLDLKDAALLRYFVDFKDTNSMSRIIVNDKPYYWIMYDYFRENLPILDINSNVVLRRRLKKLEECGVLEHYHKLGGGSFSYYCLGNNYECLLEKKEDKKEETEQKDLNNNKTQKFNPLKLKSLRLKLKSSTNEPKSLNNELKSLTNEPKSLNNELKSLNPQTQKFKQNNSSIKDINKYIYSAKDVEEIWKLYPNKKGRAQAFKKIPLILNKIGKEKLIKCIEIYSREVKGKDKQYILNGSTFFNGRYLDYLDTNFTDNDSTNAKTRDKPNKPKYKFILEEDM